MILTTQVYSSLKAQLATAKIVHNYYDIINTILLICLLAVLGIKPRALHTRGQHSTTEPHP